MLHLSSHADDGTPGTAVLVETRDVRALHAELHERDFPFLNPGIGEHPLGHEMTLVDPASNRLRLFERTA